VSFIGKSIDRLKNLSGPTKMFIWVTVVGVALDQWTKYLVVKHLTRSFDLVGGEALGFWGGVWRWIVHRHPPRGTVVEISRDFWHLRYVENPGAAWGFLSSAGQWFRVPFFLLVSCAAMAFIIAYFRKTTAGQGLLRVALAMVFSGAVGNFLDRIRLGYVIDFVDWHWYDRFTWPTFNIADAFISVGVGLLILDMLLNKPPATAEAKDGAANKAHKDAKKAAGAQADDTNPATESKAAQ